MEDYFKIAPFLFLPLCDGGGEDTYFWEDHWVEERLLSSLFSHLYHFSVFKNDFADDFLLGTRNLFLFLLGFVVLYPIGKQWR